MAAGDVRKIDQFMPGDTGSVVLDANGVPIARAVLVADPSGSSTAFGATKDAGANWTTTFGVSGARFTSANASAAAAAVTDAPTSGQKLVITDLIISVDTQLTVTLTEQTSGTILETLYMAANSTIQLTMRGKWKLATADRKLMVQTSASGNISVSAYYYSEA